jgi:hypothetical protein
MGRQEWLWPARGEGPTGSAGPKAEWAARLAGPKTKKNIFQLAKALEIFTRRFRRNFDMRIFPKFF